MPLNVAHLLSTHRRVAGAKIPGSYTNNMLSRVADNLYWMILHLERAEHAASLIDEHLNLMLDSFSIPVDQRWTRVTASLGVSMPDGPVEAIAHNLTFGESPFSIVSCIASARENAPAFRLALFDILVDRLERFLIDDG